MSDRDPRAIDTASSAPPLRRTRRPHLIETGAEFAARIDLGRAHNHIRAMFESAGSLRVSTRTAAEAYADFDEDMMLEDAFAPRPLSVPADAETVVVSGELKGYDITSRLGQFAPDNGLPDLVVQGMHFQAANIDTVYEGARVTLAITVRPHAMTVLRVLDVDNSTAIHPSRLPRLDGRRFDQTSPWTAAVVRRVRRKSGTAIAELDDGAFALINRDTLRVSGLIAIDVGDRVYVKWVPWRRRRFAAQVCSVHADITDR